mmetsp:Transcript_13575/g.34933  ORF Transcript_13575/g.34933 Transcript_13575/m.34933 type:complete len:331 (-) Transcript_13575:1562-2554(-)
MLHAVGIPQSYRCLRTFRPPAVRRPTVASPDRGIAGKLGHDVAWPCAFRSLPAESVELRALQPIAVESNADFCSSDDGMFQSMGRHDPALVLLLPRVLVASPRARGLFTSPLFNVIGIEELCQLFGDHPIEGPLLVDVLKIFFQVVDGELDCRVQRHFPLPVLQVAAQEVGLSQHRGRLWHGVSQVNADPPHLEQLDVAFLQWVHVAVERGPAALAPKGYPPTDARLEVLQHALQGQHPRVVHPPDARHVNDNGSNLVLALVLLGNRHHAVLEGVAHGKDNVALDFDDEWLSGRSLAHENRGPDFRKPGRVKPSVRDPDTLLLVLLQPPE